MGAYLAVTGKFHVLPILLGLAVLFWVSGFDIIYALQDEEFDRGQKLFSIPVWLGKKKCAPVFFHRPSALHRLFSDRWIHRCVSYLVLDGVAHFSFSPHLSAHIG